MKDTGAKGYQGRPPDRERESALESCYGREHKRDSEAVCLR